jgi:CBS domain-containing protein
MNPSPSTTPSTSLAQNLGDELQRFAPFAQMARAEVEAFVLLARQSYYAPGETLLWPADGPVARLLFLRRGSVAGGPQAPDASGNGFHLEAGDLFPVAAWLARRAVSAPYTAIDDCFCLEVPAEAMHELVARSAVFADFLNGRVQHVLALSRQAQKAAFAAQALNEQSMEARLGSLPRRALVSCAPGTPLSDVLQLMQLKRVGSVLVLDDAGAALGIFTRHDLLERVALAQPPMATPIAELMTRPVHTLDAAHSVQDAALLMSRHGLRHVPVTEHGRVVAMVSERDLFALQRLSLRRIGGRLREAADLQELVASAPDIRHLAHALLGQGLSARSLTELISHLNDLLAERAVQLVARQRGLDLQRACWLAFGSEGRSEQTIATDQDNGLVFAGDDAAAERPRWLALGQQVNDALDASGYPLCRGLIMAGQPDCCLAADEWIERFGRWIDHGAPEDLLKASIYFDFRPLAGALALAAPLREFVRTRAAQMPRFTRQLAQNALRNAPRLNWLGALDPQRDGVHEWIDLKLNGTMVFVDAARLYALAQGVDATGTRARLEAVGAAMQVDARECQTWIGAFEFLQMLRLRVQAPDGAAPSDHNPNRLDLKSLNDIDRRLLKESFRAAQRLQQRITLDYLR